jgi:hypothetical protein
MGVHIKGFNLEKLNEVEGKDQYWVEISKFQPKRVKVIMN